MAGKTLFLVLCTAGAAVRAGTAEPGAPQRVICGSPAVTEIVFALGCGARVAGVSGHATYPPEAAQKPRIGGWIDPNREQLLLLKPDLILSQGRHERLAAFAEAYGMRFHGVTLDTLDDVLAAVRSIARVLGVAARGAALADRMRAELEAVRARVADAPPEPVALVFGRVPGDLTGLTTVGPGTFLDGLLEIAGGRNVFGDATGAYPRVSKEALLERKPRVILEVAPGVSRARRERLRADWRALDGVPAVEQGRIHYMTNDFLLVPGPRLGRSAAVLAAAIHPGRAEAGGE
ncbi:MAG: ABC transporter substrate-binding protein [Lentisphaerae bacterium]|nr:ABC transporter substrate-binding protein [Lentisphaerota bacterium]